MFYTFYMTFYILENLNTDLYLVRRLSVFFISHLPILFVYAVRQEKMINATRNGLPCSSSLTVLAPRDTSHTKDLACKKCTDME